MHNSIENYVVSSIQFYKPTVGSLAYLKFGFSEKASNFEKIFIALLTIVSCSARNSVLVKKLTKIFFKNVDKSYYTNFNRSVT